MSSITQGQYNLFTSLPDDLIREVCEWDTTYRYVFSGENARQEIMKGYWSRKSIQDEVLRSILFRLHRMRESKLTIISKFFHMNTFQFDNVLYFTRCTDGMRDDEIDTLPDCELCEDIYGEISVYFSVFEDVLRWAIIPKTFEGKADAYFKREELEGHLDLYDGMCTLCYEQLDSKSPAFLHYHSEGGIKKMLSVLNLPLYDVFSYILCHYSDAISVEDLKMMSLNELARISGNTSRTRFVLWSNRYVLSK